MATSRGSAASAAFSPWVTATLFLILFLVVTPQVFVIAPHFLNELPYRQSDAVAALIKTLLPFNLGAIGILSNYYICITTDPGIVPKGWRPPQQVMQRCKTDKESVEKQPGESALLTDDDEYNEDDDRETDEDRQSITTSDEEDDEIQLELRYCKPCKSFKPPRAHHCRTCKRCVLRMDHHCPWIANCVGQRNYASFIRFLAFVDITCTMHLVLLCARVADWWWLRMTGGFWRTPSTFQMVFIVINFALCVPTFLFVGIFSLYHFWCLCSNTTTIEAAELDKVDRLIRRGRIRDVDYPFDLGMLRNVLSIFGRSPLRWCVPAVSQGDGLSFDVGEGLDDISQYAWPPSDPDYENRHQSRPYVDGDPFTYGHNGFNPSLQPSNQLRERVRRGSEGYEVEGRTAMMTLQDEAEEL